MHKQLSMINKIINRIKKYLIFFAFDFKKSNKQIKIKKNKHNGFLYIFTSDQYVDECIDSILSLKKFNNEKICIFTESKFRNDFEKYVDIFIPIKSNINRPKIEFMSLSPFKNTVYLDTDTFIVSDISDLFQLSSKIDLAAVYCHSRKRKLYSTKIPSYNKIPYSFSELNSGVIFFKKSKKIDSFFQLWKKNYYKYFLITNGWDQPSFRIALWEANINIFPLPVEYNVRPKSIMKKINNNLTKLGINHMQPKIMHMHLKNKKKLNIKDPSEYNKKLSLYKKSSIDIVY